MKTTHLLTLIALVTLGARAESILLDFESTPFSNEANVSKDGMVALPVELGEVQCSKSLAFPLRLVFKSDGAMGGRFGEHWSFPALEARVELIREAMMLVHLPCGKKMYLRRQRDDNTKFSDLRNEWTGSGGIENFKIQRSDGWVLEFDKDGFLKRLKSDDGATLEWTKAQKLPQAITLNGKELVSVRSQGKNLPTSIAIQGLPDVVIEWGKVLAKDLEIEPAIIGIRDAKGKSTKLEYDVMSRGDVTTGSLEVLHDGDDAGKKYFWERGTGIVKSANGWIYTVTAQEDALARPRITRVNDSGEIEEYFNDRLSGVINNLQSDGVALRAYQIKAPGPTYGKIRKVVYQKGDEEFILLQKQYDVKGRVISESRIGEAQRLYKYAEDGSGYVINDRGGKPRLEVTLATEPNEMRYHEYAAIIDLVGSCTTAFNWRKDGVTVNRAGKDIWRETFTPAGDPLELFSLEKGTWSFAYDANSQLKSLRIDSGDSVTDFLLKNGQLQSVSTPEGAYETGNNSSAVRNVGAFFANLPAASPKWK